MCCDSLNWAVLVRLHGRYWYKTFINGSNIWVSIGPTIGVTKFTICHCHLPQLFGSSANVWYVMCIDFLNGTLWVRFHGWYWYQSFIDRSNIWRVDRTEPSCPELNHPPLGRSYLVVVPSHDMSCPLIIFTGLYGWDSMTDWYPSYIGGFNICGVDSTRPWGPEMHNPPLGRSYLVVVLLNYMSCALILLTGHYGHYGLDFMADIDINPSSMGPIIGVWIGPTIGVLKWTIRRWAAAIW